MLKQTLKKPIITVLFLAVILGVFSLVPADKSNLNSLFKFDLNDKEENYLYKNENSIFNAYIGDRNDVGNPKVVYQFKGAFGKTLGVEEEPALPAGRRSDGKTPSVKENAISFWLNDSLSGAPSLERVEGEQPKVIYRDVREGVDLKYQINKNNRGVKEEIVLKSAGGGQSSRSRRQIPTLSHSQRALQQA